MNLHNFIDKRNRRLFDTLLNHFSMSIDLHDGYHFYSKLSGKELTIYTPRKEATIELFTHEMLHAYLVANGISLCSFLKERLRLEPLLHWTVNENLIDQIGQALEHAKMLPLYIAMGFERNLFEEKYYMTCCSPVTLQLVQSGFNKRVPATASIDLFINKFFAMKCALNPQFDYAGSLQLLQDADYELYSILEQFYNTWITADSKNLSEQFKKFTAHFVHELGLWAIKNIYVKELQRA
jgi:hypothetical protein